MEQHKPRILLVDDDANILGSLRRNLARMYDIVARETPREALALIEAGGAFAAIVSDLRMPGMSGVEFFEQAQQLAPNSGRIMLTGDADLDTAIEAVNRGNIFRFLRKPTPLEKLRETLQEAVRRYEMVTELQRCATTDSLTGLLNRGTMMERLDEEIHRARRYAHPLSIVMVDVDHFKRVNDTWGHQMGDDVLRCVARLLQQSTRDTDFCGRYGGEEFLLVLPETTGEQALVYAERLRVAMEQQAFCPQDLRVTLSGGIAQLLDDDLPTFIHRADALLYRAKETGRNRIESEDDPA